MKTLAILGILAISTLGIARAEDTATTSSTNGQMAAQTCPCCQMKPDKRALKKAANKEKRAAKRAMNKATPAPKTTAPAAASKASPTPAQ